MIVVKKRLCRNSITILLPDIMDTTANCDSVIQDPEKSTKIAAIHQATQKESFN